jgi:hypothetical protein
MAGDILQIEDFSGGLTDYPLGRPKELAQENRNLLIDVDNKYVTRPGSSVDGGTDARAKLTSPVHGFLTSFDSGGSPYRLTTGGGFGKVFYDDGASLAELTGPTGNHLFDANHGAASDTRFASASWNGHHYVTSGSFTQKPQKVYRDSGGVLRLRTAGLPAPVPPASAGTVGSGSFIYKYAFVWRYDYTVGNKSFTTRSRSYQVQRKYTSAISGSSPWAFNGANIPTFGGTASDNYDTSNLILEVYRSESLGTTLYLLQKIPYASASSTFTDTTDDTTLVTYNAATQVGLPYYANGGTTEIDAPPVAKFVHVTERGIAFYGHAKDGTDVLPNRIFQSVPGIPDGVPRSFYVDLNDDVTGISSYQSLPIFFDRSNAYRGEGAFDRVNPGNLIARRIDDAGGCVSHNSIVQTEIGVFFAGDNGFYWTDGYKKMKISEEINVRFAAVYDNDAAKQAIQGCYDSVRRLVYWTFSDGTNSDAMFALHLRYGVKPGMVFSEIGGNFDSAIDRVPGCQETSLPSTLTQNFRAKALLFANRKLYRGDDRGYTFYSDDTKTTDPRVDTSVAVNLWGTQTIPYDYRTVGLDFGAGTSRKWTPRALVKTKNLGNLSVQIRSDRDQEGAPKNAREIKRRTSATWGESGLLWGDPVFYESGRALYEDERNLPAPGIRCSYRSLWLQNAFTVIQKSDNIGTATLGTGAAGYRTAQLDNVAESWPDDILDYFISFASDGYTNKYLITARSSTTVTFHDPLGLAPPNAAGYAWQVHGFAKGEVLGLEALHIPYTLLTGIVEPYRPGNEGGNS